MDYGKIPSKRHPTELRCLICDEMFAEVWPDRLLIFSRHYGRTHTTAFSIPGLTEALRVPLADETQKLKLVGWGYNRESMGIAVKLFHIHIGHVLNNSQLHLTSRNPWEAGFF